MSEPFTLKYNVMMHIWEVLVTGFDLHRVHTAVVSPCPYLACLIFKVERWMYPVYQGKKAVVGCYSFVQHCIQFILTK